MSETRRGLGLWWVVAVPVLAGIVLAVLDHVVLGMLVLAAGLGIAALLRLVLPADHAAGLRIRAKATDVVMYSGAALNVAFATLLTIGRAPLQLLFGIDAALAVLLTITLVRDAHITRSDVSPTGK